MITGPLAVPMEYIIMNNKILLDFYSGSHGHFLEYVVNTWIYRGPKVANAFVASGACHGAKRDSAYKQAKIVEAGHYTEFDLPVDQEPAKVIEITVDSDFEYICYQVNISHRAGDIPEDKKIEDIPRAVRVRPAGLRNNYYAKLNGMGYDAPEHWRWSAQIPQFEFPMRALYNLGEFYSTLKQLADFLEHTFNPDPELYTTWCAFMAQNQGYQSWSRANQLLESALAQRDEEFSATAWEQAILNYLLTRMFGMHEGPMFFRDAYVPTTGAVWREINETIVTFDSKF